MKQRHRLLAVVLLVIGSAIAGLAGCDQDDQPAVPPAIPATTPTSSSEVEPGIFDDRILFGQSAAFSGPAQQLGSEMRLGIEAAFYEVNQRGGVHGRQLDLLSLDDAYEPEAAIANTAALIDQHAVFALIGAVGTPTSRSVTPLAAAAGVPYIAPFTGAAFLREAEWDNVVNLRASYNQETEEMVSRLTRRPKAKPHRGNVSGRFLWPGWLPGRAGGLGPPRHASGFGRSVPAEYYVS